MAPPGLDGLVFAGGPDLDPRCYGAPLDDQVAGWPDQARDAVELELMQAAIEAGTPLLAICRGLQVLNVARGGTLLNDQPDAAGHDRYRPGAELPGREVRISPASSLGALLGASVMVPACRHQGLARLGSGVVAIAWAAEQVVAAAELTGHRFGVGVHWHPEQGDDLRIFEELRAAAAARPHLAGTAAAR